MLIGLFLATVAFMFALDLVESEFKSTQARLLLRYSSLSRSAKLLPLSWTGIPWPDLAPTDGALQRMNLNLELARPECSGDFGALESSDCVDHAVVRGAAIAVYGLVSTVEYKLRATRRERRHSGRAASQAQNRERGDNAFTIGAVFFVKSFLRAFDCVASELDGNRAFMASAPEIECAAEHESDHEKLSDYRRQDLERSVDALSSFGYR